MENTVGSIMYAVWYLLKNDAIPCVLQLSHWSLLRQLIAMQEEGSAATFIINVGSRK